jgi:uncharacterized protein YjiK
MRRVALAAGVLAACAALNACRPADAAKTIRIDSAELAKREQRLAQALGTPDSGTGRALADPVTADSTAADSTAADSTAVVASSSTTANVADDKGKKDEKKDDKGKEKNDGRSESDSLVNDGALARWILPRDLDEISGITLTSDGRLLAHGDERAQISEIDYRRGIITKQFVVGRPTIKADIEGIASVNGTVFLLASNGTLYEFREGENGQRVDYITSDTHLGKECEFEGLAYDPAINSMLLACKNVELKQTADSMVIYRWKLQGGGQRLSKLAVPLDRILPAIGEKELHPSDITVDPRTGNYVIIASIEEAIVEITPAGEVVFARKLAGQHNQPESIAITKDGILIIGDEAGRRPAVITLYRWPQ